ncbi:aminopeptidase N [Psychrobium sp. 1_MG-2023]|uniref:aminopeptidase N n=1 Tax=Psychrobium sp. 1_MG-2023 TaxID=3062624 RepID=UPI000C332714|nr:aminopeptidase N [Psychrobium sp. 1_MG-2023]MDP2560374.1 aminopeptidase N [Psychrobium sp. 1_MG-2023]PKF55484.1 aminopeptidase N [Alteromonadales bacterium alter-6D02]
MSNNTTQYLKDYQAPNYTITTLNLEFNLDETLTQVIATSQVKQLVQGQPLVLDGENIQLVSVAVNQQALTANQYQCTDNQLIIDDLPERFELTVVTELNPTENTNLEGLYVSGDAFCTQCEAQGFRRITYYLDRPDVMAVFTTKVIADKEKYPYLLSNGNKVDSGELANGKHFATWHDPHKKPAYLFALVAGDFDLLEGQYVTRSGRTVQLEFFVDKGNKAKAQHALESLQRAMKWDEERFNLEYDLDIYMVVAVDFFNMGAMENKGLNVFNSKYVLADNDSATDVDYHGIESVIGHEYFHNWTGNRITCRDWFQLSLKEGLTVFRDQEFSSDVGSRAVNRIDAVKIIRSHQFSEDAGPMSHPIRPEAVMEMNNFYTVTVYNKGAEVIRMIHTLLGEERFQQGMANYIERFDGMAVTCDDFVDAMEQGGNIDLSQFRLWYSQAGTPTVDVTQDYDQDSKKLTLTLEQSCPVSGEEQQKQPFHIPVKLELLTEAGEVVTLDNGEQESLLELTQVKQKFAFDNINQSVIPCLLGDFSAPVKLGFDYSEEQLATILAHSANAYSRWDSAQKLFTQAILNNSSVAKESMSLSSTLIESVRTVVCDQATDPALIGLMIELPAVMELFELVDSVDVDAIITARNFVKQTLATTLKVELKQRYLEAILAIEEASQSADKVALRALKNSLLGLLGTIASDDINTLIATQFEQATNMTDSISALQIANVNNQLCLKDLSAAFEQRWKTNGLVMDKWFATVGSNPSEQVTDLIVEAFEHPSFSWQNPNRVRSLIGAFAVNNPSRFHSVDGSGYQFLTEQLIRLNEINPQIAARLITPLLPWEKISGQRSALMREQLERLAALPNLSKDLVEKVSLSLGK